MEDPRAKPKNDLPAMVLGFAIMGTAVIGGMILVAGSIGLAIRVLFWTAGW